MSVTPAALGPKNAREFRIPIKYAKQYGSQTCQSGTSREYRIVGRGWHTWPANDTAWKWGSTVLYQDGKSAWQQAKPANRVNAHAGALWQVSSGKSLTVGVAASVFGVGIRAYTTYSSSHEQIYHAGKKRARWHPIWCVKGPIVGTNPNPGQIRAF